MHYYQHHIGDFIKDTSFLTNEEVGIYLKLLWIYYDTESPLPNSMFELSMKVNAREQQESLQGILEMFFKLDEDGWHHTRCDKEIAFYHQQIDTASRAGKASAAKRAMNKSLTSVESELNERSTSVQPTKNQEPLTINHKPDINICPPSGEPEEKTGLPKCNHKAVVDLYHEHLPTLRKVEVWNDARKGYLRQRWREVAAELSEKEEMSEQVMLDYWARLFKYISQSKFLTGRVNDKGGRAFVADLEWILKPSNFAKIIEGKYHVV
jgi:uncharacterized protein YdaU (DUF1376 family)